MIEEKTQNELRELFNPDGSPLRKHQLKMLEILKYVDKICKDNGIKYWLSSGTCLGAVRHNGFIPWDDDVDIEMMREDFLKFERVFKETDLYVLQTHKNDKYYPTPFNKVRSKNTIIYDSLYKYRGVFIDILCIDYINRSLARFTELYQKVFGKYIYNFVKKHRNNKIIFEISSLLFLIMKKSFFSLMPIFYGINSFLPSKSLRHIFGAGWVDNTRIEEDIFPLAKIEFEGIELPVPGNYDKYLTRLYGNYMNIPSYDKIARPHVQYYN